jgi:hypothetical protein
MSKLQLAQRHVLSSKGDHEMKKFRVHVRQWFEEIAEVVVDAESEDDAILTVNSDEYEGYDFDWRDGNAVSGFAVTEVEEITE